MTRIRLARAFTSSSRICRAMALDGAAANCAGSPSPANSRKSNASEASMVSDTKARAERPGPGLDELFRDRFFLNNDFEVSSHVLVQLHRHGELTQGLQRLVELDLTAIQVDSLFRDGIGDVTRSDRSEQMIVFARSPGERHRDSIKLFRQLFGLRLLLGRAPHRSSLHLHDDGLIPGSSLNGQLARQKIVAPISFGNLHHVAARSQLGYIFFENDFHDSS